MIVLATRDGFFVTEKDDFRDLRVRVGDLAPREFISAAEASSDVDTHPQPDYLWIGVQFLRRELDTAHIPHRQAGLDRMLEHAAGRVSPDGARVAAHVVPQQTTKPEVDDSGNALAALVRRIEVLEAEADIRRVQARYMALCDTPCPEFGIENDQQRIEAVLELYTEDAIWEGVGPYYDNQFGRAVGKDAIRAHFNRFWPGEQDPELLLNVHYLTSEQIHVAENGVEADGQWIHFQPWLFSDGRSLVRGSRLNNAFRREGGTWRITRTRTENVAIVDLPNNFASSYPSESVLLKAPGTNHLNDHVRSDG